ncbi:tigger transposable element-derived protein 4-like, partial [Aphis craccivora]
KIARTYFSRGRHNLIDVFYLALSYSKVPKQLLRDNANFIQDETNLKHVYNDRCSGDMSYTEFKYFCTSYWRKGRFNFIVINKDCERDNGRYRHGFDTFVII